MSCCCSGRGVATADPHVLGRLPRAWHSLTTYLSLQVPLSEFQPYDALQQLTYAAAAWCPGRSCW